MEPYGLAYGLGQALVQLPQAYQQGQKSAIDMENARKAQEIQNFQFGEARRQAELQKEQMEEQDAMYKALVANMNPATGMVNYNTVITGAGTGNYARQIPALYKQMAEQQKTNLAQAQTKATITTKMLPVLRENLMAIRNDPNPTNAKAASYADNMDKAFALPAGTMATMVPPPPPDAASREEWVQWADQVEQQAAGAKEVFRLKNLPAQVHNEGPFSVVWKPTPLGDKPMDEISRTYIPQDPLAKVKSDFNAGIISAEEAEERKRKINHISANINNIKLPSDDNFDPSQPLPKTSEDQANYIAETGKLLSINMRNPKIRQDNMRINSRAQWKTQQGGFTVAEAGQTFTNKGQALKYWGTGAGGTMVRKQNVLLHHARVFRSVVQALNNGNTQLANKLGNELNVQFGSDKKTNFDTVNSILSKEVSSYLIGSAGSADERSELTNLIPSFGSPSQIEGALSTMERLVEGQKKALQRQRTDSIRTLNVPGGIAARREQQSGIPLPATASGPPGSKGAYYDQNRKVYVDAATGKDIPSK